jgi:hypothetical protein
MILQTENVLEELTPPPSSDSPSTLLSQTQAQQAAQVTIFLIMNTPFVNRFTQGLAL